MSGNGKYFEKICDRFIDWFDSFIEKAKEAEMRGLMMENKKEAKDE